MSARIRNTKLEKKIIMDCAEVFAEYHFRKHNRVCLKGVKISVKNVKYQECKVWKKSLFDSGTVMFDHSG